MPVHLFAPLCSFLFVCSFICLFSCAEVSEYYEDGEWREMRERLRLGKVEGQVWLTLYKLLLDKHCQQKYEFTSTRKATILQVYACTRSTQCTHTVSKLPVRSASFVCRQLRKYMSTPLLEQIPHLADLQRYLEQLSFMDPPTAHRELILQQVKTYPPLFKPN